MTLPDDGTEPKSLRDLAARVIDDATAYLKAEVTLAKESAITRVKAARPTIGLLLGALMLSQCAIIALAMSLGMLLARWLGLPGGFAVAGLLMISGSLLLGRWAVARIRRKIR